MRRINGYPLYLLGAYLNVISDHLSPLAENIGSIANETNRACALLERFVGDEIIPFKFSKDPAKKLLEALNGLRSRQSSGESTRTLDNEERIKLQTLIIKFSETLERELAEVNLYFIDQKQAWDMTILIEKGETVLSERTLSSLPASIKSDLREAARCLAFDIPTAVGFHIFRAVEAVVKEYFKTPSFSMPGKYRKNLGGYIEILENNRVDNKIIDMLRHLKDNYRNPILHPQDSLESDEADSLFGVAKSAITIMVKDIENRKRTKQLSP